MAPEKSTSATFEENFKKLETLAQELQNNRVSVDELVPRMKQALTAIKACKDVLKETRVQLKEIGQEFVELEAMNAQAEPDAE